MESLINQIRVRFFGFEEENKEQSSRIVRDRRISSRRTRSFKGDNRKDQSWVRRQLSRESRRDYDKMDGEEFRTAVAAAAFVINSIENKEDDDIKHDPGSLSMKSPGILEKVPSRPEINEDLPNEANRPTLGMVNTELDEKVPKITNDLASSTEKSPSFVPNKRLDENTSVKEPEIKLGEVDVWEKTEMEKIKERYQKLKATILEWEKKKKTQAKKKLTRKEGALERKRARALQDFMRKMEVIDKISGGATLQAEKNRINEEIRVKEKGKGKMSSTALGKVLQMSSTALKRSTAFGQFWV